METVSAADQENKRKPSRAGSVPPARATTPVNSTQSYVPGNKAKPGVVRPGSTLSQSAPSKRQRLGENHTSGPTAGHHASTQRAPLGAYRGGNGVGSSPTKGHSKTPIGGSSLPRPVSLAVPKPGTQHHALGHGRMPGTVIPGGGDTYSTSGGAKGYGSGRYASATAASGYDRTGSMTMGKMMKKSSRARRESFKPRPSMDDMGVSVGLGARWAGFGGAVQEEDDEGY